MFIIALSVACLSQKLEIHHINVGQGDSTLIIGPNGAKVLIDGGKNGAGKGTVFPYLKAKGITKLDYMIATHMDADHIGGLDEVLEEGIQAEKVYDNGSTSATQSFTNYVNAVVIYAGGRNTILHFSHYFLGTE